MKTTVQVSKSKDLAMFVLPESKLSDEEDFADLSQKVRQLAGQQGWRAVILDFSNVSFMSSTGLGMLIELDSQLKEDTVQLALIHVQKSVQELLEMTNVDRVLTVFASRAEAARALAKG